MTSVKFDASLSCLRNSKARTRKSVWTVAKKRRLAGARPAIIEDKARGTRYRPETGDTAKQIISSLDERGKEGRKEGNGEHRVALETANHQRSGLKVKPEVEIG